MHNLATKSKVIFIKLCILYTLPHLMAESPINPTCVSLDCDWKLEYLAETYTQLQGEHENFSILSVLVHYI